MNFNYPQLLLQLSRFQAELPKEVMQDASQGPDLPPAAEDALREITAQVATDLQIPHCVARERLIYIGQQQDIRLSQWLLRLALRLHLEARGLIAP